MELARALVTAVRDGDDHAVRALLARGASPEAVEADTGMIALAIATDLGKPPIVRALLAAGARADAAGPDGVAALAHAGPGAYRAERLEILRSLLDAGADPNRRAPDDGSALYDAASDPEFVGLLLDYGADPNVATPLGETPLSFCTSWGHLASIRRLLAGGADPNGVMQAGEDGVVGFEWSVLCFAAQEGRVDVIEALIAGGTESTWANRWGRTAASVAFDHRHPDALAVILDLAGVRGEGFTAPVAGLRARLRSSGGRPLRVVLEVQCTADAPLEVTLDDPTAVRWVLARDGSVVPPVFGRADVVSSPRRTTLAPGDLGRWTVSHRAADGEGGGPVDLDLVTAAWRLDGDAAWVLTGTWRGDGAGCWSGELTVETATSR